MLSFCYYSIVYEYQYDIVFKKENITIFYKKCLQRIRTFRKRGPYEGLFNINVVN